MNLIFGLNGGLDQDFEESLSDGLRFRLGVCEGLQVPGTLGLWGWVGRDDELEERYLLLSIAWLLRG